MQSRCIWEVSMCTTSTSLLVREGAHGTACTWIWLGGAGSPGNKIRSHAKLKEAPCLYAYPGGFAFKAGMQGAILFSPPCCSRCCQPHLKVPPVFGLLQSGREDWLPPCLIWLVINPESCLIPACYRNSIGFEITYQNCFLLLFNAELSIPSKATAGAWRDTRMKF